MRATCYKTLLAVISVSVVALMYNSFKYDVFAGTVTDPECKLAPGNVVTCCWIDSTQEYPPKNYEACIECTLTGETWSCGSIYYPSTEVAPPTSPPTPTPFAPEGALPQGEVQQLPPTPPPTGGKGLFGSEVLPTPPAGLAPPTEPPAPTSDPTVPPETGQGEEDGTGGGGGIKPPVKDLLPDTGITEQPDVQQPEEEQPSNEGEGPAGPLT